MGVLLPWRAEAMGQLSIDEEEVKGMARGSYGNSRGTSRISTKGSPSASSAAGAPGSSVKSTRVIRGKGSTKRQGGA